MIAVYCTVKLVGWFEIDKCCTVQWWAFATILTTIAIPRRKELSHHDLTLCLINTLKKTIKNMGQIASMFFHKNGYTTYILTCPEEPRLLWAATCESSCYASPV